MWRKISSGNKTENSLIYTGYCYYFGFVCVTGGVQRNITIYDYLSAAGIEVENFVCDANKPTDGHSHSIPVMCGTGLYLGLSGGTVVVYYMPSYLLW